MTSHRDLVIDWLEIEASAPGKVIISGEHSVVYDRQAIAAAIDLRTRCIIKPTNDGLVRLNLKNVQYVWVWPVTSLSMTRLISRSWECLYFEPAMINTLNHLLNQRYVNSPKPVDDDETFQKARDAAIAFLLLYIGLGDSFSSSFRPSLNIDVESQIPIGSGLGSSAAYAVALCGALMKVFLVSAEPYITCNWALNIERYFHRNASGVDNSIVTSGGYILFHLGKARPCTLSHRELIRIILIDTGVSRCTRKIMTLVSDFYESDVPRGTALFNSINDLTTSMWRRINDKEFHPGTIETSLQQNHDLLMELGVGHPKLDDICSRADSFNLTAKMTGAGGGGVAFVLYVETDDLEKVNEFKTDLTEGGYKIYDCRIGCEGLTVKVTPDPEKVDL